MLPGVVNIPELLRDTDESTGGSSTYEHLVTETDRNREVVQGLHARLLKQRSGSLEWT